MKQLSPMDSMFVHLEANDAPFHISPILIYEPSADAEQPVRFKDILQRFQERIHKSPVFRRKLVTVPFNLDNPYWVEDLDFDLEFHVRHLAIPKPGDWRQLYILLSRLHSRPIDLKRPPWEAYVIEGLDNATGIPNGSFVLYFKIHHCAIDGATGIQIIEALHDLEPHPKNIEHTDTWKGESEPSSFYMLQKAYINNLVKSPKLIKNFAQSAIEKITGTEKTFDELELQDHSVKGRTRFNAKISPHRVFGGYRMDLSDLKLIKNTVGQCTLNDVILAIVGGAMRDYLKDKNELPDESLLTIVPISTRAPDQFNASGGNEVSAMRILLRTDIAEPVERLKLIHQDAVATKAYADAVGAERISSIINSIPAGLTSLGMRAATATGLTTRSALAHTCVTNVPGPQVPMYLCGAKATLFFGAGCLLQGNALFHTVNSYYGSVCITYLCCREIMHDPDFYHQCISNAFQSLLADAKKLSAEQDVKKTKSTSKSTTKKTKKSTAANKAKPITPARRTKKATSTVKRSARSTG